MCSHFLLDLRESHDRVQGPHLPPRGDANVLNTHTYSGSQGVSLQARQQDPVASHCLMARSSDIDG